MGEPVYRVTLTDFTDHQTLYAFEMDSSMHIISCTGLSPEDVLRDPDAMECLSTTMDVAREFVGK